MSICTSFRSFFQKVFSVQFWYITNMGLHLRTKDYVGLIKGSLTLSFFPIFDCILVPGVLEPASWSCHPQTISTDTGGCRRRQPEGKGQSTPTGSTCDTWHLRLQPDHPRVRYLDEERCGPPCRPSATGWSRWSGSSSTCPWSCWARLRRYSR